jgi:ATP-dependent helicase/nuclease subunit A
MAQRAAYQIDGRQVAAEDFYAVACNPARSVAVEACAGAGKTWMLVSRIIRALLDGCPAQDILAITFTKKAAGEMRDRLNAELRRCAGLGDDALIEALTVRGMAPDEARRRAEDLRTLYQRVNALGRPVQVRTFHSWFAALLRSAPLSVLEELQLPAQYELLEDDARAIALVWPHFYAALTEAPEARQDFMDSVALHGRHQTLKALENALQKRVEFALADAAGVVDLSVQAVDEAFPAFAGWETPDQFFRSADEAWLAPFWAAARALGGAKAVTFSAKGSELEQALTGRDVAAALAALLTQKDEPRKFGEKILGIEAVREAQARAVELLAASRQHEAWQHQRRMTRLTRVLLRSFSALKRERGWVDMNDVEGAALRLLGDAELSGWMQQRLDARVRHLLIDEFQDTNPLQWQALYGWLSGYAGAGAGDAPGVFLVGDPKQSIYRFRRAEPQVFKAAQAFVVNGLSGALLSCDHTRRCAHGVVDALNTAMQAAVETGEYGNGFRNHTTASQEAGAVLALPQVPRSLRDARGRGDADEDLEWRDSLSTPRVLPEDTMSALEARQAANWVAAEMASGRWQADGLMVLSRRRERLAWMHDALLQRGIASEQPEKLDLCEAPVVQDVVALLDVLVSPRHDLSLARALKSPLFGWSDEVLAQLARLRQHWTVRADDPASPAIRPSWREVLRRWGSLAIDEQDEVLQLAGESREVLERWRALWTDATRRLDLYSDWIRRLPPHDALSAIYEHGDVLARFAQALPASQRGAALAQLRDLLAQSLAQEGGRFLTTYRLVRALKAGGIPATPTHTPGAVRLLTIHGAKGLEAHTVLLLDTDSAPSRPDSMGVLVDWPGEAAAPNRFVFLASEKTPPACAAGVLALEQQARALEELNALYVALTRAELRLVISSHEPHARSGGTSWYQRLQALAIPLDEPVAADVITTSMGHDEAFMLPCLPDIQRESSNVSQPHDAVRSEKELPEDDLSARLGLALHRLLQWHPTAAGFEWHEAHARAVAQEFALDPDQAQQVLDMARRTVSGEAAWVWDASQIDHWGNEVALFHQGELLRLDRLVHRRAAAGEEAAWWVLDFKSAERPERQPELLAQMRRYRDAVSAARPGAPLRLAFINPKGQLIELSAEQLAN